jgi:16S rRNA (cytidine1402-2'-O)-methyltransferase
MASGLSGQSFAFHGYLPIESKAVAKAIRDFEKESRQKDQTQIFIETPYRSNSLFQTLVNTLSEETLLCIASNITGDSEEIRTYSVRKWKTITYEMEKVPVVFLFQAK